MLDPQVWGSVVLTPDYYTGPGRRLARTSDGTLCALYTKLVGEDTQIWFRTSSDGGGTWGGDVQLTPDSTSNQYPALAVDSQDNVHVVYKTETGGAQVWYLARIGGTWQTTPERISDASYASSRPMVAVDALDQVHVVWEASGAGTVTQIWWRTYQGGAWQSQVRLSSLAEQDNEYQQAASVAADGNGGLHCVWHGNADGYTGAQIWYRGYQSGVWREPVRISTGEGMEDYAQACPTLAVEGDGTVHAAWEGCADGYTSEVQIWYAGSPGSGATWTAPVRVSTASGMEAVTQRFASAALDAEGRLHVFWDGGTGSTSMRTYRSPRYEGSWTTPAPVTSTVENRRPLLRWASFNNHGGDLGWLYYAGDVVGYVPTTTASQAATERDRKAQSFLAPESRQLAWLQLILQGDGTSQTMVVEIHADVSGSPGTLLGSATTAVASSSYQTIFFDLMGRRR